MECPEECRCAQGGLDTICKARDIGLDLHLECLEADAGDCRFVVPFGHSRLCCCSVRLFLCKRLGK